MDQYLKLLEDILENGEFKGDRTGTGTQSLFGPQIEYDLTEKFPALTTKSIHMHSVVHELLWMISGSTNIQYLCQNSVRIWNEWSNGYKEHVTEGGMDKKEYHRLIAEDDTFAAENGDLGPVYGKQWRDFNGVDQVQDVVQRIKDKPDDRRLIITAWNPPEVPDQALPPCHSFMQFYVHTGEGPRKGTLDCKMFQRSADVFLGVPFNMAQYGLLTHLIAQVTDLKAGRVVHTFGDVHIYNNHREQVMEQLKRTPGELPTINIDPTIKDIDDFRYEHISLSDYKPQPPIKADVAI